MPIQDPKCEVIRAAILTLLGTVSTVRADGASHTLTVEPIDEFYNGSGDLTAIAEQGSDEWLEVSDVDAAVGQDNFKQEFLVSVHIQRAQGGLDFDRRGNLVAADVRKAVMAAADAGAFSGLGVDWVKPRGLSQKGVVPFTLDGISRAGIVIPFMVKYRTALNNPYA